VLPHQIFFIKMMIHTTTSHRIVRAHYYFAWHSPMPTPLPPPYLVRRAPGDFEVTGRGSSPAWQQASILTDFSYPWEAARPTLTCFKAVHGEHWVYFLFEVDDPRTHVEAVTNDKREVIDSSRVEIFFRKDDQLTPYYCLEIDASGRVLDYLGNFHRQFEFDWAWPAGEYVVKASTRAGGYLVEVALSKRSLQELGLLSGNAPRLQAGLFRAECTHTVVPRDHMRWISWVQPDSPTPDFHIPSAFGVLELEYSFDPAHGTISKKAGL
jgi:hypothetical protein